MTETLITYTNKEAKEASLQYFNGEELAADVFVNKYALRDAASNILESTPDAMHRRIARELARIEQNYENPMSEEEIYEYLKDFRYIIPQGSPMAGVGDKYRLVSLSNCVVLKSPSDSYGSIMKTDEWIVQTAKRRLGSGMDVSNLRPKDTIVNNSARTTSGIGPFIERFSNTLREVGQGGRRGAGMVTLSIHHPEVETFIKLKQDKKTATGINMSLRLSDAFMQAVVDDTTYTQQWPVDSAAPKIVKEVRARDVWKQIIHSAWFRAEPGLLFWDRVLEGPADSYAELRSICTNACSEIPMNVDFCKLLVVNPTSFVVNPYTAQAYFDEVGFSTTCQVAQRFLDDLVDLEIESIDRIIAKIHQDPESESDKATELEMWHIYRKAAIDGRRIGLGPVAIGDTLAMLGIRYGSPESIEMVEKIYKLIEVNAYRSSIKLAKERGAFAVFDLETEQNNQLIKRVLAELTQEELEDYKKYGRRNCAMTTTAPTGSVALVAMLNQDKRIFSTTSGIEPAYTISYIRKKKINHSEKNVRVDFVDELGDKWQEYKIYHKGFELWQSLNPDKTIEESPYWKGTAMDQDWKSSVLVQAVAQKWVDHAISKTCNLPADATEELVGDVYMEAWKAGCFLKDTKVYTENGLKSIETIKPNDKVFGIDGKLHNVTQVFQLDAQPRRIIKIKSKGLEEITCTSEHPIAVVECIDKNHDKIPWEKRTKKIVWKMASEVKETDYLLTPKHLQANPKQLINKLDMKKYIQSQIVVKRGRIFPSRKLPWEPNTNSICANSNSIPEFVDFDEQFAKFLGWFIAEGHYSGKSCIRMNFNLNERPIVEELKQYIEKTFGLSARIFITHGNGGNSLRLEFGSKLLSEVLETLVGKKSVNKHLPPFFVQLPTNVLVTLIESHFSGDTGVTKSHRLAQELFFARLLIQHKPLFKPKYSEDSCYTVNTTSSNGPCGRSHNEYLCYKVHNIQSDRYHGPVYNFSVDDVDSYLVNGIIVHNCKGFTVYRDGSRDGVLTTDSTTKTEFVQHNAPKRPPSLTCEVHHVSVLGEKWTMFVGILDGKPFEIFGGLAKLVSIPKRVKTGKILKHNGVENPKGRYDFHFDHEKGPEEETIVRDIGKVFENVAHEAFTRTISLSLRHGVPVQYVAEQLQKGSEQDSDLQSFARVAARVLKKYISDGTKASAKNCSECGAKDSVVYKDGCSSCTSCGFSRCN